MNFLKTSLISMDFKCFWTQVNESFNSTFPELVEVPVYTIQYFPIFFHSGIHFFFFKEFVLELVLHCLEKQCLSPLSFVTLLRIRLAIL